MSHLAADFEAVAQIVIFAAIAIAALIKRVLEDRKRRHPEQTPADVDESAPRRHEEPARPAPHARPRPAPEPAASHRAPGALGGLPAPTTGEPRGRLTDFEKTRLHFSSEQPTHTAAATARRTTEASGRALLFGRDLSPHDRVRSALLWREVLEPPLSLTEPR